MADRLIPFSVRRAMGKGDLAKLSRLGTRGNRSPVRVLRREQKKREAEERQCVPAPPATPQTPTRSDAFITAMRLETRSVRELWKEPSMRRLIAHDLAEMQHRAIRERQALLGLDTDLLPYAD